jgi:hypothetical protein
MELRIRRRRRRDTRMGKTIEFGMTINYEQELYTKKWKLITYKRSLTKGTFQKRILRSRKKFNTLLNF